MWECENVGMWGCGNVGMWGCDNGISLSCPYRAQMDLISICPEPGALLRVELACPFGASYAAR